MQRNNSNKNVVWLFVSVFTLALAMQPGFVSAQPDLVVSNIFTPSYMETDSIYTIVANITNNGTPLDAENITVDFYSIDRNVLLMFSNKWGYDLGGSSYSSPAIADVNSAPMIFVTIDRDLFALNGDGTQRWNYSGTYRFRYNTPAVGDVDDDGSLEVVVYDNSGYVYSLDAETGLEEWIVSSPDWYGYYSAPVIVDVDGDNETEVLISNDDYGQIISLNGMNGSVEWVAGGRCDLGSYTPGTMCNDEGWIKTTPAVGDIDGDGMLEVVAATGDYIYAFNGEDGSMVWSNDQSMINNYWFSSPVLADIDKDGELEIIIGSGDGYINVFNSLGVIEWSYPTSDDVWSAIALGDLDGDDYLEIVTGDGDGFLYALNHDGSLLWSRYIDYQYYEGAPVIFDSDNDGSLDVLIFAPNGFAWIYDGIDGRELFHGITPSGCSIWDHGAALGNLDDDSYLEAVITDSCGYVFAYDTRSFMGMTSVWPTFQFDNERTGFYRDTSLWPGNLFASRSISSLSPGSSVNVSVSFNTANLPGNQTILVVVDPEDEILELNDTNNDLTEDIVISTVDLIVSNVTYSTLILDNVTFFNATIENIGVKDAGEFYVSLYVDDLFYSKALVDNLSANSTTEVTLDWLATGGWYNITIKADDESGSQNIVENNETNNKFFLSLPFIPGYDLVVEDVTWTPKTTNVTFETTITFNATVKNIGEVDISSPRSINVGFYIDGSYVRSGSVYTTLPVNGTVNVTYRWSAVTGNKTNVTAEADRWNYIPETNESNNELTRSFPLNVLGPDLIVTDLTRSPNVTTTSAGDYITFNATVKNIGEVDITSPRYIYVGFYIDGSYVGSGSVYTSLPVNGTVNVTYRWSAVTGNKTSVTAEADCRYSYCSSYIPETNESNNELTRAFPLNVLWPDLVVTDLTWSPNATTVSYSDYITFNATVKNIGEVNISSPRYIYVGFYIDDSYIGRGSVYTSLPVNGTANVTYRWSAVTGNKTNVTAEADLWNYIPETNESNNELTRAFPLNVLGPDLIVTDLTWSPNVTTTSAGDYITFNATVKNIGEANIPSRYIYVGFYIDGSYVGSSSIEYTSLPVNGTAYLTYRWSAVTGNKTSVTAKADPWEDIPETNESNNELTRAFPLDVLGPDLIVTDIAWSPNVTTTSAGDYITFSATIKNVGEGNISSSRYIYVGFYIDGSYVGSGSVYTSLPVNGTVNITYQWPAAMGNKTNVTAKADLWNYIPETSESNNELTRAFPLDVLGPDLIVTDIAWSPNVTTTSAGDYITFSATIKNIGEGNITSSRSIYVGFYIDDSYIGRGYVYTSLPVNGTVNVTYRWSATMGNKTNVTAKADLWNYIPETNESNNELTRAFPLTVLGPDLIVTDIAWSPNVTTTSAGDYITFSATIKNIGEANIPSRSIYVGFYIDGSYVGRGSVYTSLPINGIAYVTYRWPATIGNKTSVTAKADPGNYIPETNESNNELTRAFPLIVLGPDLIVTDIAWSPNVTTTSAGDYITFSATIKNIGEGNISSSRSIYAGFYIDGSYVGYGSVYTSLPVNGTVNVTYRWPATMGNKTSVTAKADCRYSSCSSYIPETSESNNELTRAFPLDVLGPDLIVTDIAWSPNVTTTSAGDYITFSATIKNVGEGNISSSRSITVGFYIDGSYIGRGYAYTSLPVNGTVNLTYRWPATMGNKTNVTAKADLWNYIPETNESNNELTRSFPLDVLGPDLIVTDIAWSPNVTTTSAGDYITFNATVNNIGEGNISSRTIYVGFYIDGSYIGRGSVYTSLPVNGTAYITYRWPATIGNKTSVTAKADCIYSYCRSYIPESNESNNELTRAFSLDVLGPDLIVTDIAWSPNTINTSDTVTFNVTLKNIGEGNISSRSIYVGFYIDGSYVGYGNVYTSLSANGTVYVTYSWTATAGEHTVTAKADCKYSYCSSYIPETNESNNEFIKPILVGAIGSDLVITDITWTPNTTVVSYGDAITFSATVKNVGERNQSFRNIYVSFFVDGNYAGYGSARTSLAINESINVAFVWHATRGNKISVTAKADCIYSYCRSYIPESNESNNELTKDFPLAVLVPDLVIENITWTPEEINNGNTATFYAKIHNAGAGNVSLKKIYATFYIDGFDIGTRSVYTTLPAGGSVNITQTWPATIGNHTLRVVVDPSNYFAETNEFNNDFITTIPVIPDIILPSITDVTQSPQDINGNTGAVTITATITDNVMVDTSSAKVFFSIDGMDGNVPMAYEMGNSYQAKLNIDWKLYEGNNLTYYIYARDINGNSNISENFTDFIDPINFVPQVKIITPNSTKGFTYGGTIKWEIFDRDNFEFNTTLYYRSNSNWTLLAQTNMTEFYWDTSLQKEGFYQLLANVTDGIDYGYNVSEIFMIDRTAPSIALQNPVNTAMMADPIGFQFRSTDNLDSVMSCSLAIDGQTNVTDIAASNNSLTTVYVPGIREGDHNWSINCSDDLAISTIETAAFYVDRGAPIVVELSPLNGTAIDVDEINITFTASDAIDIVLACDILLNNQVKASLKNVTNGSEVTETLHSLPSASYSWYVRCKDSAGNTGSGEVRSLNVATDLAVYPGDIIFDPSAPVQDTLTIVNITIHNLGKVNTSRIPIRLYRNKTQISTRLVDVKANSSYSFTYLWDLTGLGFGQQNLTVEIDEAHFVDYNLSNNNATAGIDIVKDVFPPTFLDTYFTPANITEHTRDAIFGAGVTDIGSGVAVVYLNYSFDGVWQGKPMEKSGLVYKTTLTSAEADWDANQGKNFSFYFSASDSYDNTNQTKTTVEYIDIINDVPIVTIYDPIAGSVWSGSRTINYSCDNDNEGLCYNTIYYWKPHLWAPAYPDPGYWQQGIWAKIGETNGSTYPWNTTGFSGWTRINVSSTDKTYNVSKTSAAFVVDNVNTLIYILNYYDAVSGAYVTGARPVIQGRVNGILSKIVDISINRSDFVLTKSPAGKVDAFFTFSTNSTYSESFWIKITATDEAGDFDEIEGMFVIDTSPPVLNAVEFSLAYTNAPVMIKVNASDDYSVNLVTATLPTASGQKDITLALNNSSGLFEGEFTAPLVSGEYSALIRAYDSVNNSASVIANFSVALGPELYVYPEDITFTPDTPITGDLVTINALIHNKGSKNAANVSIAFLVGEDTSISKISKTSLNIDANAAVQTLSIWNTTGYAGSKQITVAIERSEGVYEIDYSDNNASVPIFIDGPDLSVQEIAFVPPSTAFSGQTVTITATIQNTRNVSANTTRVNFYLNSIDKDSLIDYRIFSIPSNNLTVVSIPWQTAGSYFDQTIFVVANPDDLPAEIERSNNIANASYYLKRYAAEQIPDLIYFPKKSILGIPGDRIRGMASADFDADNRTDFVAAADSGKIVLFHNDGVYYLNDSTKNVNFSQILIDDLGEKTRGATTADFYKDGYPDLVVGTESGKVIFYNNINGTFAANLTLFTVSGEAYGIAASDFNNDNEFDLVVGHMIGHVDIYLSNWSGIITNETFIFDSTITTRDQPYGMTTGDFDLDLHVDIMVGDRLGQLERLVYEKNKYNGFLFADTGAFAHGLTAADIDFNGKLDLIVASFDGKVRIYYSREGGLVQDPLIISNMPNSYGITGGDYDSDNDIDFIIGSEDGNVTMLMNSLRISKSSSPEPSPPGRNVVYTTTIQNPWAREMMDVNLTEFWQGDLDFVEDAYAVLITNYPSPTYFYADMYFYGTPLNDAQNTYRFYLKFPNTVLMVKYGPGRSLSTYNYPGEAVLENTSIHITNVLGIFNDNNSGNNIETLFQRDLFKYQYKLSPNNATKPRAITDVNYSLLGYFNTINTDYLLSDDVTNLNNEVANVKNINLVRYHNDRDFLDTTVVVPDYTPVDIEFSGRRPFVPGQTIGIAAVVRNLNNIAVQNIPIAFIVNGQNITFNCGRACTRNYTLFSIGALAQARIYVSYKVASADIADVTVIVNPQKTDIETNYSNNELTRQLELAPSTDLSNEQVFVNKNPIVEGETLTVYTMVKNIGKNKSYYETVYFDSPPSGGCYGVIPRNRIIDCNAGSLNYDSYYCSGGINCRGRACTYPGNLEAGENTTTSYTFTLGDHKRHSQGVYNISTVITNVGALDANFANNANFSTLVVLPSRADLRFDYRQTTYRDCFNELPLDITNPGTDSIQIKYKEFNDGGYDADNYDTLIYLDNNDSMVLKRTVGEHLTNHTGDEDSFVYDWSLGPEGDHVIYVYLDYGRDENESTARAVSKDGLVFIANESGIKGNELQVSIDKGRHVYKTRVLGTHYAGSTRIKVGDASVFSAGDKIVIGNYLSTVYNVTDVNTSSGAISVSPTLTKTAYNNVQVYLYLDDVYRVKIARTTVSVGQTDYDLNTTTTTSSQIYDLLADNITDIKSIGDVIQVIRNGGYNIAGEFVNATQGLYVIDNSSNLSTPPTPQTLKLVISGSIEERNERNNVKTKIFRWKEIAAGGIGFSIDFPAKGDVVAVTSHISNSGDIATGDFTVTLYVDGKFFENRTISLNAHKNMPITFFYTVPAEDRMSHHFELSADSENVITHEDESNNNVTADLPVSLPFELRILAREHDHNFLSSYKNAGNDSFVPDSFGLEDFSMEYDAAPVFVDYDGDADLDLILGSLDGRLLSFENTGTITDPRWENTTWEDIEWTQSDLQNIPGVYAISGIDVGARSVPEFVDLDNDTYVDLVVGDAHGFLESYKRVMIQIRKFNPDTGRFETITKFAWQDYDFNLSKVKQYYRAVPRFVDLDADGDYDLVVGNAHGRLVGYENTGNASSPYFEPRDWGLSGIELGSNAAPVFADLDKDSLYDILAANSTGVFIYKNIGNKTRPLWEKTGFELSLQNSSDYKPTLADLNNDGGLDLVAGSNNNSPLKLRKGYYEPVNVQVINYANHTTEINRIEFSVFNKTTGAKITDLYMYGPFSTPIYSGRYLTDVILKGREVGALNAFEKEFDINIPVDLPDGVVFGVTVDKKEDLNPIYQFRPELGGNTYEIFVDDYSTYEITGSYRVFLNNTLKGEYECYVNWCPIYNLTIGETNLIVGSGAIRRYQKRLRTDFDVIEPNEPALAIFVSNFFEFELKPGYIEDVDVTVINNNRRAFTLDRISMELYDPGRVTGNYTINNRTYDLYDEARIINLYTDTAGFILPPGQTTTKKYKVYIPEGVPLNATFILKAIEKYGWRDKEWDRSNIKELYPQFTESGGIFSRSFIDDLPAEAGYNSSNTSLLGDPYFWGNQDFDWKTPCDTCANPPLPSCEPGESLLKKELWLPETIVKAEYYQHLSQICSPYCVEESSYLTTWINGRLKSSYSSDCGVVEAGWSPNYYDFDYGKNNEMVIYSYGPHRKFDIRFYEQVGMDYKQKATVEPVQKAYEMEIAGIGHRELLRRQYEEQINVTITNNDDDAITIDVLTLDMLTPKGKKIHLLTDTTPRKILPLAKQNVSYTVIIPGDVPLDSTFLVQVERVFEFPDRLWLRNKETNLSDAIAAETRDYHWGDTLPTNTPSNYRKHFFIPMDVTRAELILGGDSNTEAYLNGKYQGRGYPGWSPISVTSDLREGENNMYSVIGAIPDTASRIYSGKNKTGGKVIEVEQDVFYAVFGVREANFVPDREPFRVYPDEEVTARILIANKYNRSMEFDLRLYVVDFGDMSETTLKTVKITAGPYETKSLEVDVTIPATVSSEARLQLSGIYHERLEDKNWLRGSNFDDVLAKNKFYDDSKWGVVSFSDGNEGAIYYRKHIWIDSLTEGVQINTKGVSKMWVNGLEVPNHVNGRYFSLGDNQITKSEENMFTIKAQNFDVDADIILNRFVPIRSTDLEIVNLRAIGNPLI